MIKLTDGQIQAMGTPCFACAEVAKILIASKLYEDKQKKAEYEQAVFTHWALGLYELHGDEWLNEGNEIIKALHKQLTEAVQ